MKIEDVMTRQVAVCDRDASLSDAARLLWENDCGCVPVVDRTGRAVGMITDRDICMAAYTSGKPLHELAVGGSMGSPARTCAATDAPEQGLAVMTEARVRRLPVVDEDGRTVGVLSLNDLVRAVGRAGSAKTRRGLSDALIETLARVGEPRVPREAEHTIELAPAPARSTRTRSAPKRKRAPRKA